MQRPVPASYGALSATLLGLLPLLNGCAAMSAAVGRFEEPQLVVRSSKVAEYTASQTSITLNVEIYNPNTYALTLRDLHYELLIGESVLGRGNNTDAPELPGGETVPMVLPFTLAIEEFVAAAKSGLTFGEVAYELRATLSLSAPMLEREVAVSQTSVLQVNLPLGLVRKDASTVDSLESTTTQTPAFRLWLSTVDCRLST